MIVPFAGSLKGTVRSVSMVSIHGDIYADVLLEPDGAVAEAGKVAVLPIRVPTHAMHAGTPPREGARIEVSFLMQQVTGVRPA